jgi:hypothetical protein
VRVSEKMNSKRAISSFKVGIKGTRVVTLNEFLLFLFPFPLFFPVLTLLPILLFFFLYLPLPFTTFFLLFSLLDFLLSVLFCILFFQPLQFIILVKVFVACTRPGFIKFQGVKSS